MPWCCIDMHAVVGPVCAQGESFGGIMALALGKRLK
jgi:hypothetical protein